ncbi:MAG TPA: OmpH family outer membrane protein [Bacteroidota bacterium]|nr:OmpH family outer membrane protein [Bacteroidota bacterium]
MKHTAFILFIALIILIAGIHTTSSAQALKIGFVNSSKILQEYPEALEANKKLDDLSKVWQGELDRMSKEFEEQLQDYKKKEALMADPEKRSAQEALALLEQKGLAYRQQRFGSTGDLASATDSLLGPIKKKVLKVIEQAAKEEKLHFIFDRNDQITVLLYGEAKFDYTNYIIDKLKRGTPTKPGK